MKESFTCKGRFWAIFWKYTGMATKKNISTLTRKSAWCTRSSNMISKGSKSEVRALRIVLRRSLLNTESLRYRQTKRSSAFSRTTLILTWTCEAYSSVGSAPSTLHNHLSKQCLHLNSSIVHASAIQCRISTTCHLLIRWPLRKRYVWTWWSSSMPTILRQLKRPS